MGTVAARKKRLRSRLRTQRESLSKIEVGTKSRAILDRLTALPSYLAAKTVHTYVAWGNEVDTHQLIRDAFSHGKCVIVPRVDVERRALEHYRINSFSDLSPGAFGILEPVPARASRFEPGGAEVVVVPGIAFDPSGHRLGFGGGYYDAFLKPLSATKIALAYDFQIVDLLPTREEDERVDLIITEKRILHGRST